MPSGGFLSLEWWENRVDLVNGDMDYEANDQFTQQYFGALVAPKKDKEKVRRGKTFKRPGSED